MRYKDAVAEGRRLIRRSEEDQWRLAELTAEVLDSGKTTREWADDIGVSHTHVVFLAKIWTAYRGYQVTNRPAFRDAYAEAKGLPLDSDERRINEAASNVRKATPEQQERIASELPPAVVARQASRPDVARAIARNDAAREAVEDQAIEHRATQRPEPSGLEPGREGRHAGSAMARRMDTDLATGALRQAAGALAEAIMCKEEFGIEHPEQEAEALAKIEHYLAAYRGEAKVSDDDRRWLDEIGVSS